MKTKYQVIGNFGGKDNQIDGQTIKTICVADTLDHLLQDPVKRVDLSFFQSKTIFTLTEIFRGLKKENIVFLLINWRAILILMPFIALLAKINKVDIRFLAIGGRLGSFLSKRPFYRFLFKVFEGIYVENEETLHDLQSQGLKNSRILPNFRFFDEQVISEKSYSEDGVLKCVYAARIRPDKGIEICIEAVSQLAAHGCNVELHIYGMYDPDYEARFKSLVDSDSRIHFHGLLDPFDVDFYEKLSKYDLMLFATSWRGEGFPGTILDAFISGLPVIASDWKYNASIVRDGELGIVLKEINSSAVKLAIEKFNLNRGLIEKYSKNVLNERWEFNSASLLSKII